MALESARLLLVLALLGATACWGAGGSLEDARALQDAGAYAESIAPLRALLATEPDDPEANYRLGLALVRTGEAPLAVFPLKKAARDPDQSRPAGLLLAATLIDLNNFEEAIGATDYVLAHDPSNTAALLARAQAAIGSNRSEIALDAADRLLATEPDHAEYRSLRAAALMHLGRLDEAEEILRAVEQAEWSDNPTGQGRACLVLANFYGRFREDPDRAAAKIRECLERFPDDPELEVVAAGGFDEIERPEDATALLRVAFERNPQDQGLRVALARRLRAADQQAQAESLLEEGARTSGDPRAWISLAGMRRSQDDPEGALAAVDEALALAADSEDARFVRADVLMDLGRLEEAEKILASLRQPVYLRILRGRLMLERGDPAGALEELTPAIREWPNNAGARMLAARAAHELGDVDRAITELREASRSEPTETDAAVLLARIQLGRGDHDEAFHFARRHINQRGTTAADAHLIAAWARAAQGRFEEARKQLEELREKPGYAGTALAEEARLVRAQEGPAAALRFLREQTADLDLAAAENEPALRRLLELAVAAGQLAEATALVEDLSGKHPDSARLEALRGQLALAAGDGDAAAAAFERALGLDATSAPALAGQAELALAGGDAARALALLDQAAEQDPASVAYPYRAAQITLAGGDGEGARRRLEAILAQHPEHAGASNDLAFLLASRGESLDRALQLAEAAQRLEPGPEVLDTVGFVRLARGEHEAAVAAFREALAQRPDYASARYHLGLALARGGDTEGAREALQAALATGPFPESPQAERELARLQAANGGARE